MKKIFDIAFKDMTQSFRSMFALMFMFVIPILMTGMFYLMFGGSSDSDEAFTLPITQVIIVNKDSVEFDNLSSSLENSSSLGDMLTMIMTTKEMNGLVNVTLMDDDNQARAAVDNQDAGVALIIPGDTTDQFMAPQGRATIEFYQDPTLTIGPAIVKGIISQILDDLSGSKITLGVTLEQLENTIGTLDDELILEVIGDYFQVMQQGSSTGQTLTTSNELEVRDPNIEEKSNNQTMSAVSMIMTGMTVFYIFFTGASGGQSILKEEGNGTLPRLFTTPTPEPTILAGKFLAIAFTIIVQITVLLVFGNVVFQIQWGGLGQLIMISAGITIAAAGFGIFLISWVRTERQAGVMIGGVVTAMGMMGMMPIFVMGMPNPPAFIKKASLFVPQGWAVEGLQKTMLGGSLTDVLPNMIILFIWAAAFLLIGIFRFKNRFN